MGDELKGRMVRNDVIDEVFELEEGEDIMQKKEIFNQPIDAEVVVSDDSQNYIPTPQEERSLMQDNGPYLDSEKAGQTTFTKDMRSKAQLNMSKQSNLHNTESSSKLLQEISRLDISKNILTLFTQYSSFDVSDIELKVPLKPFIPEFTPAIGEVEAYLKPSRPDGQPEPLGLEKLDEPALNTVKQSYLDLLFKEFYKGKTKIHQREIHSLRNASANKKAIQSWIRDVGSLQSQKKSPAVLFFRPMPDIDSLMQSPDAGLEAMHKKILSLLSSSNLPLTTEQLVKLLCALLDVPIYSGSPKSLIESLHIIFTLYTAFTSNEHFQNVNRIVSQEQERLEFN